MRLRRRIRILGRVTRIIRVCCYDILGNLFLTIKCYGFAEMVFRRGRKYAGRAAPELADGFDAWIAFTWEQRGDTERALQLHQRRIEANPQKASCHIDLADFYLATGDRSKAIDSYRKALTLEIEEDVRASIRSELERLGSRDE